MAEAVGVIGAAEVVGLEVMLVVESSCPSSLSMSVQSYMNFLHVSCAWG